MSRKLVIVESPNKIKSISNYLGADYDVQASIGHIRDLPQPSELPANMKKGPFGKFAVDVEGNFTPYYVVNPDKKKVVAELKRHLKEADELYLATDDDREGEAIAWHLKEVLKPKVPVRRMTFTEITREAITRALDNTREIDIHRVDAQETRRILDRLVGYEISPVLWRKIRQGLSAGRVQSVATRLVVERERERMAFIPASYWGVEATFAADDSEFATRLVSLDGRRVATGRDFADDAALTSQAQAAKVVHLHEADAQAVAQAIEQAQAQVGKVETRPYTRRPAPPFTTSTLQQEASRKLRLNSRDTMRVAQGLYESGYITYMRTDSTALSSQAVAAARTQIGELYGSQYVPEKPRVYATKNKGAQEAHEAIRPAGDHFRTPSEVKDSLQPVQFKLYELIWKRTVASQMANATGSTAVIHVQAPLNGDASFKQAELTASGTVITFKGFLAAYEEGRDADRYEGDAKDVRLPEVSTGQELETRQVQASGHETTPPPRYTEASLVKALEEREIGRPSTYASIMSVISDRGYVDHRGQALVPTWLAFAVTRLLEENFAQMVDYDFTASMEADLDRIALGEEERVAWLRRFYNGDIDADPQANIHGAGLKTLVDNLGEIDARAVNSMEIGDGITLRVGRYGPYLEDTEGKRANVPADLAPDELSVAKAHELFAVAAEDGRELGVDPETGHMIVAKSGRFGPYVSEVLPEPEAEAETEGKKRTRKAAKPKPRTASLFKDMDLSTVTLDDALKLLSLPRVVGTDAEGVEITAQNGRYGPYLTKGKDSRSLETEAELFTVTLEQALELFSQPKRRRGAAAPKGPLRELGTDPNSGLPVVIKDGRFGPYFTDGKTNVTLRRDDDPATVTPELAYERLAEKRAKGPAKKTAAKKATTKKAATKTTAKKATTKKAAGTKAAGTKASAAKATKAAGAKTSKAKASAAKTSAAKAAEASEA